MNRRRFLEASAVAVAAAGRSAAAAPNERIAVAVMGVRGRGGGLLSTFSAQEDVEVRYVCDVDRGVLGSRSEQVAKRTGRKPKEIVDFREALDDPQIDAVVMGTPDHWHAIPTILACQAGKDVYVEKPDGHNVLEGRIMVAAAKKHSRIVQLGTQARSGEMQQSAMRYIASGKLGKARFAKAWESSRQGAIGYPRDGQPPAGVDYDLWLGPAPKRPFNAARFHGSWRWFFDYGTGDLGNDGVHRLDMARWGLETALKAKGEGPLGFPQAISAHGGKRYFDDAQEWPDTMMVTYDYPQALLTYEMRVWSAYPLHEEAEGAAVYGDEGYIVLGNSRWRAYDARGKQVAEETGGANDTAHARNFLECMRTRKRPAADLETVGHPSSMLCHLGNAAWRAGRTLRFDPEKYAFIGDDEAQAYLTRSEYRTPWKLPSLAEL